MIARGEIDFSLYLPATLVFRWDAGVPITALTGLHPGCFELFAHEPIRTISDLKGKKVGIDFLGAGKHRYVTVMAANIGLDPEEDIEWVSANPHLTHGAVRRGKGRCLSWLPARAAGAARPQGRSRDPQHDHGQAVVAVFLLHAGGKRGVRPRSSRRHQARPASHSQSQRHLRRRAGEGRTTLVDRGFTKHYDYALQTLTEIPYASWREFDPEDSLRFFALRLHEVGMISSSPNTLLAEGTDWRFLNELKRELKA